MPQLRPRALYWFRWGAAWTWVTGFLLVLLVFYHGRQMFARRTRAGPAGAFLMVAITFLAFVVYDPMARSHQGQQADGRASASCCSAIVILGYLYIGNFGYRATVIHTGALFGTLMAANVWMRIWPAQQKIITAIRDGQAPDAGARRSGRHALAPQHLHVGAARLDDARAAHDGVRGRQRWATWFWLLVVIAIGWGAVVQLYKKAAAVKGF